MCGSRELFSEEDSERRNAKAAARRGAMSWTALHRAAKDGCEAQVESLIQARADVNASDDCRNDSFSGWTPLHHAADDGNPPPPLVLIGHAASRAMSTGGRTNRARATMSTGQMETAMEALGW